MKYDYMEGTISSFLKIYYDLVNCILAWIIIPCQKLEQMKIGKAQLVSSIHSRPSKIKISNSLLYLLKTKLPATCEAAVKAQPD
jgi:hypothetical protein